MWVTLYTDASHNSKTNEGTFAFWAKSEKGRLIRSGLLKGPIKGSTWAEMYCIFNALFCIRNKWPGTTGVHIVTDSMFCVKFLTLTEELTNKNKEKYKNEIEFFSKASKDIKIKIKHQKAHSGSDTQIKWLNDWCDKAASKAWQGKKHYGG